MIKSVPRRRRTSWIWLVRRSANVPQQTPKVILASIVNWSRVCGGGSEGAWLGGAWRGEGGKVIWHRIVCDDDICA